MAGSALFPDDAMTMLGVLNSSVAAELLHAINPTVNFQVGDLAELPVPREGSDELRTAVRRAIDLTRQLDQYDETTTDFVLRRCPGSTPRRGVTLHWQLQGSERDIERIVSELYGVRVAPRPAVAAVRFSREDLARRWVSYAVGVYFGRWPVGAGCPRPAGEGGVTPPLQITTAAVETVLAVSDRHTGAADAIDDAVGGLDRFLTRYFFAWHVTLYQRRPIYWAFGEGGRLVLVAPQRGQCRPPCGGSDGRRRRVGGVISTTAF